MSEENATELLGGSSYGQEEPSIGPLKAWLKEQVPQAAWPALAVLLHHSEVPSEVITAVTSCSDQNLRAWVECYRKQGIAGLGKGEPPLTGDPKADDTAQPVDPEFTDIQAMVGGPNEESPSTHKDSDLADSDAVSVEAGSGEPSNTVPVEDTALEERAPVSSQDLWQEREPADDQDAVEHILSSSVCCGQGWRILAASRRGRQHAHEGRYREDAFRIKCESGWHLIGVADGAGSASLSRVGSRLAVAACMERLTLAVQHFQESSDCIQELEIAFGDAVTKAWGALHEEADARGLNPRELATTLLALAHKPTQDGHVIICAQIGDGILAATDKDGKVTVLAEPDQGKYAGETTFLTGISPRAGLADRIHSHHINGDVRYVLGMTDGVSDDFFPVEQQLGKLVERLDDVTQAEPGEAESRLIELLGYPKRGSFDDRTLAVIAAPYPDDALEEPDKHESDLNQQ